MGLVGQLTERIDVRLLEAVADAGFSLLLVGPYDPRWEPERFAALIARPNVRYTGRVPASEVPSYLAAMDVGLTPYADTPFNQASFPLKTLEYFGAGLPVVSTDLPGSRWLRDDLARSDPAAASQLMALASDGTGFAAAVRRLAAASRAASARGRARRRPGRSTARPARHRPGPSPTAIRGRGGPKRSRPRSGCARPGPPTTTGHRSVCEIARDWLGSPDGPRSSSAGSRMSSVRSPA